MTSRATLPAFENILVARAGSVWIGSAKVIGQKRTWTVRGADGKVRGTIPLPAELEPIDADAGWLLARTKDEDGVEYIVLHTITR